MAEAEKETEALIDNIFGNDDDDDDNIQPVPNSKLTTNGSKSTFTAVQSESDNELFGVDSDDDQKLEEPGGKGFSRLNKRNSASQRTSLSNAGGFDSDEDDDLFGGEDTKAASINIRRHASAKLSIGEKVKSKGGKGSDRKKGKKGKRKGSSSSSVQEDSLKKRRRGSAHAASDREPRDSGDEYDSGSEVEATHEDSAFIAAEDDDENAGILREYEDDFVHQNFDDERPDARNSSKKNKKTSSSSSSSSSAGRVSVRDTDPMSETLRTMQNPKAKPLSDPEMEVFVDKLQRKMAEAVALDEQLYREQKPAIHKMRMLDAVRQAVSLRSLHHTLLEKDILGSLRDWIAPRKDKSEAGGGSLPALAVRTAIYELLLLLPCQPDHLKRAGGPDKPPIGFVIVQLRKHKQETASNKRILKEIMDKWSRPIFSKNADVRMGASCAALLQEGNADVRRAVIQRYASAAPTSETGEARATGMAAIESSSSVRFDSVMAGAAASTANVAGIESAQGALSEAEIARKAAAAMDPHGRVRTPYNHGFLFTVQPELRQVEQGDVNGRALGEGRMKIFRKTVESGKGAKAPLGKKLNPRYYRSCLPCLPCLLFFIHIVALLLRGRFMLSLESPRNHSVYIPAVAYQSDFPKFMLIY